VLAAHEREKKKKYLGACCLEQRRHFSPFVVSMDGLLGKEEAKLLLKKLSARLAEKVACRMSVLCIAIYIISPDRLRLPSQRILYRRGRRRRMPR
jgi:hypothetical protein